MYIVNESVKGNLENVKYLVEQDSNILVKNYYPLRAAAYNGHFEIVKYLVEQGVDISIHNYVALKYAAHRNHLEIVNYFRKVLGDEIPCHECLVRSICLEFCF